MAPRLAEIEAALSRTPPRSEDVPLVRKAAVAAVFREAEEGTELQGTELLFIRRAEHPRDPWSGQMGLPGGRVDPGDASPYDAAVRETLEEIGLDLAATARPIGALSEIRTHLPFGISPHSVAPFCFALEGDPVLVTNYEVQETLWIPLSFLAEEANRSAFTWVRKGVPLPMPCCRYDGRVVWGLTLKIVDQLLGITRPGA